MVITTRTEERSFPTSSSPQQGGTTLGLHGRSPAIRRLCRLIRLVADANAPVLVRGETGTGKGLVARALHQTSRRAANPLVTVSCSAPAEALESTLFGHCQGFGYREGALPTAEHDVAGKLEVAGDGTLVLDEIAEMPLELQGKLLRALEDRQFRPLGASVDVPLTARLVVTTRTDLEEQIHAGRFRAELYYRLNVVQLDVPALHERREDFQVLLDAFVAELPRLLEFTPEAFHWLQRRTWRGNVRELRNTVERLSLLCESPLIDVQQLEEVLSSPKNDFGTLEAMARTLLSMSTPLDSKLDAIEAAVVFEAMAMSGGNKSAAARLVGIDRKALERRWEKLQQQEYTPEQRSGVLRVTSSVALDDTAERSNQ